MRAIIVYDGDSIFKLPTFFTTDKGNVMTFYIRNDSGSIYNLTSFNGNMVIREVGTLTNKVDSALNIITPTSGIATYTFSSTDLDKPGIYDMYIEFTNGLLNFTIPLGRFKIQKGY